MPDLVLGPHLRYAGSTDATVWVETDAACTIEKIGAGFKITRMQLSSRATVPNIDDAKFQAIASATKEGCPVSGALKGNVQIDLEAKLVS